MGLYDISEIVEENIADLLAGKRNEKAFLEKSPAVLDESCNILSWSLICNPLNMNSS